MRALVVGDVHVKTCNIREIGQLAAFLAAQVREHAPDYVVLLGDVLDYHEKVLTPCLNAAYALVEQLAALCPVYILVGNHDYISNAQYLTPNHWMNALKQWRNVTVVDTVRVERGATFCPYVPPGRFADALATVPGAGHAATIFCHQEFRGCDLGAVRSEAGDAYAAFAGRLVVSGHIHDNQWLGTTVYYVGAPMQHAFGDREKRVVALVEDGAVAEIPVGIGVKRTVSVAASELGTLAVDARPGESVRITVAGTVDECKALKKTAQFKALAKRAKIVFRMVEAKSAAGATQRYRPFTDVCAEKVALAKSAGVAALYAALFN